MQRRFVSVIASVTLLWTALAPTVQADTSPGPIQPAGTSAAQLTDAQAGCIYGNSPITSATYPAYTSTYSAGSDWGAATRPTSGCFVGIAYVAFTRPGVTMNYVKVGQNAVSGGAANEFMCNGTNDPACNASSWAHMTMQLATSHCDASTALNCISAVEAVSEDGTVTPAEYLQGFPAVSGLPAESGVTAHPAGGTSPVWRLPLPTGPVTLYTVGTLEKDWQSSAGTWKPNTAKFRLHLFAVETATQTGITKPWVQQLTYQQNGESRTSVSTSPGVQGCLSYDTDTCMHETSLPEGYRFRVTLQMQDDTTMFLNGRLSAPVAYTEPMNGGHRIVIEGGTVSVPALAQWIPKSILPTAVLDALPQVGFQRTRAIADQFFEGNENGSIAWLSALLPYVQDKASWVTRTWSVMSTLGPVSFQGSCQDAAKGSFLGIVSTNATAYSGMPPTFDASTQTLQYSVAAPHVLADGTTPTTGTYALNLNAAFVQCLLGTSKIPDMASIELNYNAGEPSVATVNVHQDKDWLHLVAANFHYSSPTIRVRFSSPASAPPAPQSSSPSASTPTPTSTPKSTPTPTLKPVAHTTTITCVKGKQVKKVTGVNPKCPSGWKKKVS